MAIKILPPAFALDPDRLARFAREAQVLASLNHPNIAAIYGLEDSTGIQALVLELVDGPTLADRIARGPMPLDEALPTARQIAVALEAAHELGIVHRDLKPANVKLRTDGAVKVLDFGLAKAVEPASSAIDASISPTITSPAMTRAGVILGTAAYMSPEQAKGRQADKRSDVWAFGCVLYEMLTGRRAFEGDDATETIAAVVRADPDWTRLPPETPAAIRRLLRRTLVKARAQRLADIADARLDIDEALAGAPSDAAASPAPARGWLRWPLLAAAFVAGAILTAAATRLAQPRSAPSRSAAVLRARIDLPRAAPLALGSELPALGYDSPVVAVSPDGAWLAYVATTAAGRMLYVRDMSSGDIRALPGTEGVVHPFFSPDGQWVGFLTADHVKKIARQGGTVISLCEAEVPVLAWWVEPQSIFFTEVETTALSKVAADGGKRERILSALDLDVLGFDDVLPDGRTALGERSVSIGSDYGDIVRVDLQTRQTRVLVRSGYAARYVAPGYLLFARSGNLLAVRFDMKRGEVVGEPVTLASSVAMESLFRMLHASASNTGLVAYAPGADLSVGKLAWVDRRGSVEYLDVPERVYGMSDLAPDGSRVAVHVADVKDYIWIWDFSRREGRRVASEAPEGFPHWSPDGRRLAGGTIEGPFRGRPMIHAVELSGAVSAGAALKGVEGNGGISWSPQSDVIAHDIFPARRVEFFGTDKPANAPAFDGAFPSFSQDGRWVAYVSTIGEILVRSFPEGKVIGQVSTGMGIEPRWKPSGDVFYRNGRRWFSTHVTASPQPHWDPPRLVFDTEFIDTPGLSYDVAADGQRLMVVKRAHPVVVDSRIEIISNWTEIVERHR